MLFYIHKNSQRIGHVNKLHNKHFLGIVWQHVQNSPEAWNYTVAPTSMHICTTQYVIQHLHYGSIPSKTKKRASFDDVRKKS